MANINVRKEGPSESSIESMRERFSPFRAWRDLLRWDPFAEMLPSWAEEQRALFAPDFDVKETKDAFVFKADLPGIDPKDVEVKLADNRLTVSGKREQEKEERGETTYRCERSYGEFSRTFTLPAGVDSESINAELKNGVLNISISKKPEAKAKKVDVKAA